MLTPVIPAKRYLERRAPHLHAATKAQINECYAKKRSGDPQFQDLTAAMKTRLRATVGEQHWKKGHDYFHHFRKMNDMRQTTQPAGRRRRGVGLSADGAARFADQGESPFGNAATSSMDSGGVNGASSGATASAATMLLGRDEDPFDTMVSSITNPSTLESYARNVSMSPHNFSDFHYPFGCDHCDVKFVTNHKAKKHERKCKKNNRKNVKAEKVKAEKKAVKEKAEKEEGDDVEEAEEITYTSYRPAKLKYGKDHPGELFMVLRVQSFVTTGIGMCLEQAL